MKYHIDNILLTGERMRHAWIIFISLVFITACGGGGGSAPAPVSIAIHGVAATGLAIPDSAVRAKCVAGSQTGSTDSNGYFELVIQNANFPCLLQLTNRSDSTVLHSVVANSSTSNITPLTELVTSRVLGADPNVFFQWFDPSAAINKITEANIRTANEDVKVVLHSTVDVSSVDNFVSASLTAATKNQQSNANSYDRLLDEVSKFFGPNQIASLSYAVGHIPQVDVLKTTSETLAIPLPVATIEGNSSVTTSFRAELLGANSQVFGGRSISYRWNLVNKPSGSELVFAVDLNEKISFVPDVSGTYTFELTVSDGRSNSIKRISVQASTGRYSNNKDGTVSDLETGLVWMRCAMGMSFDNESCIGQPNTYTWDQANQLSGTTTFSSQNDWRLPTVRELNTLISQSVYVPVTDVIALPDATKTQASYESGFWTSTQSMQRNNYAWLIRSKLGNILDSDKTNSLMYVRLVRGAANSAQKLAINRSSSNYAVNSDGTVSDLTNNLMWKRCSEGQILSGNACTGALTLYNESTANSLITGYQFAGYVDWRIPTLDELLSLVDYGNYSPATNTVTFPNTSVNNNYLSSSQMNALRWCLSFVNGSTCGDTGSMALRLVRNRN